MVELGFSDNDFEKFHNMTEPVMENPPIQKVKDIQAATSSLELAFHFISYGHVLIYMPWFKGRCLMIMNGLGGYNG
jgi:hypothetical protein